MSDNQNNLEFPVIPNFSPKVPTEIHGLGEETIEFVAMVDTGNDGFLQLPLAIAIKAKLRLWGVRYWTMADGRKVRMFDCFGIIRFAGKDIPGIIALSETSDDCLLGMQFLEKLKMDFTVSLTRKKAIFQELSEKIEIKKEDKEIKPVEIKPVEENNLPK